ncbi:MAG: LytTR family DNA-binding domain-containing protein [Coprococcus sp.]|nr:LytTR family DNA-binding domain-containing protein [Coprococcus sp.]
MVYVSDGFHHVMDAYETKHIYYILKEKFEEKLPCIMDKAIRQLKACGSKEMAFQCHGGVIVRLKLDEIMYFERNLRVTNVVTREYRYIVDEKISEIEERMMSEDFVRCHSSFLVNFFYVKACTKKELILKNGQVIDISRSYWGKAEKEYVQWVKKAIG